MKTSPEPEEQHRSGPWGLWLAAIVAATLLLLALGTGFGPTLRFWGFLFLAVYLPGRLLTPSGLDGREALAVTFVSGLGFAGLLWGAARFTGAPFVAVAGILGVMAVAALARGVWRSLPGPDPMLVAVASLSTAIVALTQFANGRLRPGAAAAFYSSYASEAMFHCAIGQELRHNLPMEMPAGIHFSYHILYHLFAALTVEMTGASMFDVHYRLLPLLLVPLTVVAAAALAGSLGVSRRAAALAPLFLFLADDLSWLFALARSANPLFATGAEWSFLLSTPVVYGLHNNRPFLAGVAALFVATIMAARYLRSGERAVLLLTSLLIATSVEYKLSFGLLLLCATAMTAATGALPWSTAPRAMLRRGLTLLIVSFVLTLPFLAYTSSAIREPSSPITLQPGYPVWLTFLRLGVFPDWPSLQSAFRTTPVNFVLFWAPLGALLYTVGTLGARLWGLPVLWQQVRKGGPLALLAASLVLAGYLISLLLVPASAPENTVYFWGTALCLLSVLAGARVAELALSRKAYLGLLALVATLALPGTVQMIALNGPWTDPVLRVSAGQAAAVGYLAGHSQPGDVLLEPEVHYSLFSAALPLRPVVAWPHWFRHVVGQEALRERRDDVEAFFHDPRPDQIHDILRRRDVSWVWVPAGNTFSATADLRLELSNPSGRLYRVIEKAEP